MSQLFGPLGTILDQPRYQVQDINRIFPGQVLGLKPLAPVMWPEDLKTESWGPLGAIGHHELGILISFNIHDGIII
jgi:hypothetical protein